MKLGIVGYGVAGTLVAEAAIATESFVISAVCDSHAGRLNLVPAGATSYARLEELLRASCFDALAICTPTPTHVYIAKMAIAAGARVLLEKPLALDRNGLHELAEAAKAAGVPLFALLHPQYGCEIRALHQLVRAGKPGQRLACSVILQDDHLKDSQREHALASLINPWADAGINAAAILRGIFPLAHFALRAAETTGNSAAAAWTQTVTYEIEAVDVQGTVQVVTSWSAGKRRKVTEIAFPDQDRCYWADHHTERVWGDDRLLSDPGTTHSAMRHRYECMITDAAAHLNAGKSNWAEAVTVHDIYLAGSEALGDLTQS